MKLYLSTYRILICIFLLTTFLADAAVNDLLGTCTDKSIEYTNKVVDNSKQLACYERESTVKVPQMEASSVCNECSQNYVSTVSRPFMPLSTWIAEQEYNFLQSCETSKYKRRMKRREQQLNIPEICFHAGMSRTSNAVSNFYHCENKSQLTPNKVKSNYRPCLNSNYIKMTAQAFNDMADCFGFSKKEREEIFATFNHESAFNLNARSKDGARCYGQMTFPRFKDLNKYIYFRKEKSRSSWKEYHQIYNEAETKCPYLKNVVTPEELLNDDKVSDSNLIEHNENPPFTCTLTTNPYTCFFYSMYNIKIHQTKVNQHYDDGPSYLGNRDLSPQIVRDFKLRIERNEMLVIKGKVTTKNGEKKEVNWTFWSDGELYNTIVTKGYSYDTSELQIQKVTLFNPEELKTYFVHTAHNGGDSIVSDYFVEFLRRLKRRISNGTLCNKDTSCRKYREQIFNIESENHSALTLQNLEKEFKQYAARTRREDREGNIREETQEFMDSRKKDLQVVMNFDPKEKGIDSEKCSFENEQAVQ